MESLWDVSNTIPSHPGQNRGMSFFFSNQVIDYEVAEEAEEEDEGFVMCRPPMSPMSEEPAEFINDEYDICDDVIEEIEDLKRQEDLRSGCEKQAATDSPEDNPTFKVPANENPGLTAIKRRRPEVSSVENDQSLSSTSQPPLPTAKKQKLLGEGTFGKVYKREEGGKVFAVKEIPASDPKAKLEQTMLETVKHKYIIQYHRTFTEDGMFKMVMEFADRGTLTKMVREADLNSSHHDLFDEHNLWRFLNQMASALAYLHGHKPLHILHRDLKPDNILAVSSGPDRQFRFKLADFGLAKLLTADAQGEHYASTRCGTANYMAPEISSNWRKYSFGADIFSLGAILVFFANKGKHLFYSQAEIQKWRGMAEEEDVIRPGYSADLVNVVGSMLKVEPVDRPAAREVRDLCTIARMQLKPGSSYTDPHDPDLFESLPPTMQ